MQRPLLAYFGACAMLITLITYTMRRADQPIHADDPRAREQSEEIIEELRKENGELVPGEWERIQADRSRARAEKNLPEAEILEETGPIRQTEKTDKIFKEDPEEPLAQPGERELTPPLELHKKPGTEEPPEQPDTPTLIGVDVRKLIRRMPPKE